MLKLLATSVLCISAVASYGEAQEPTRTHDVARADPGVDLLSKPITVLDYMLFAIRADLVEQIPLLQAMKSWTGTAVVGTEMPTDIKPLAFSVDSADIDVGYDISTGRLTRPARDVCAFVAGVVTRSVAADRTSRQVPAARDNLMSHFMPPNTGALAPRTTRSLAYDELQRRMTIVIAIYEHVSRRSTICRRRVLGDSLSIESQSVGT